MTPTDPQPAARVDDENEEYEYLGPMKPIRSVEGVFLTREALKSRLVAADRKGYERGVEASLAIADKFWEIAERRKASTAYIAPAVEGIRALLDPSPAGKEKE